MSISSLRNIHRLQSSPKNRLIECCSVNGYLNRRINRHGTARLTLLTGVQFLTNFEWRESVPDVDHANYATTVTPIFRSCEEERRQGTRHTSCNPIHTSKVERYDFAGCRRFLKGFVSFVGEDRRVTSLDGNRDASTNRRPLSAKDVPMG